MRLDSSNSNLDKVEKGLCHVTEVNSLYGEMEINKGKYQKFSECGDFLKADFEESHTFSELGSKALFLKISTFRSLLTKSL